MSVAMAKISEPGRVLYGEHDTIARTLCSYTEQALTCGQLCLHQKREEKTMSALGVWPNMAQKSPFFLASGTLARLTDD